MKEIKEFIKKRGWKYIGKSATNSDMFEKGDSIIYIQKNTFKKQKQETFKKASARMHNTIR